MSNYREQIILGMKDMVADLEQKGFTGDFTSDQEAVTSGYVMGMLAENIEHLESVRPESAEIFETIMKRIAEEVRGMRGKKS